MSKKTPPQLRRVKTLLAFTPQYIQEGTRYTEPVEVVIRGKATVTPITRGDGSLINVVTLIEVDKSEILFPGSLGETEIEELERLLGD
jgi:hypothetical protein